jgi:hypothetical protein
MSTDVPPRPQLTRIPLSQFWLHEQTDFPGGYAMQSSLLLGKPKVSGRPYFLGWFVPSYQVIEIEWHAKEGESPDRMGVPMAAVKKYKHA